MYSLQKVSMQHSVAVALPTREVVVCTKMTLSCPLELVLEANLIMFNLLGFDIILGMD